MVKSELDIELYKSLRAEASGYVEKVPALWLQKFVLVGAVIAFLITQPLTNIAGSGSEAVLALAAVAMLPVLAMLLDAKMYEYALHARAISRFIAEHFAEHGTVAAWERAMWSEAGSPTVLRLTRVRSVATWLATAAPTVVIVIAAGLVIATIRGDELRTFCVTLALVVIYLFATAWGAVLVYRVGPEAVASRVTS